MAIWGGGEENKSLVYVCVLVYNIKILNRTYDYNITKSYNIRWYLYDTTIQHIIPTYYYTIYMVTGYY